MLSLNQGFDTLFVKQDEKSEEGRSNFHTLEESDPKEQSEASIESQDTLYVENESDDSDRRKIKGQRKGVGLKLRRGADRQRNYAGSGFKSIANKRSSKSTGRDDSKNPRKGVASVSGIMRT
jgi:hypothetical protein